MTGLEYLQGSSERPLWESVKMKPKLQWRPQDVGDAGTMGNLQPWNGASPREKLCVLQTAMLEGQRCPSPLEPR